MNSPRVITLTLNPAIDRTVTIPSFTAGAVNRVTAVEDRAGGKGVNVATALAAYGVPVAALGFIGVENEAVFTSFFKTTGIEDACRRLPGATRVGIKISDPVRGETTDINFAGLAPSNADLAVLREQIATVDAEWCVLAGSLPPGVPESIYRELIGTLKQRGVRTVLDSSGEALRQALKASPDFIKPNVHELEAHLGRKLPDERSVTSAARELVRAGVGLVVVSRGADGACFVTENEVVTALPPEITVRSTVGAGDAMVAGVVAARLKNLSLEDTARLATSFSLSALTRVASEPNPPVEPFVNQVRIRRPEVR